MGRTANLSWGQYGRLFETWCDRYLASPAAFRIDERPACAFLNLSDFVARYGLATFTIMLRQASCIVERRLGVAPYFLGIIGQADIQNVRLANALPFDGVTGYGLLPNWLGAARQQYSTLIEERVAEWESFQSRLKIPFFPVVCAGWDASIRGKFRGRLTARDGYPNSPIVEGVTPELFAMFLEHAIAFNRRWQPREDIIFLHAWNEWTECSVLEPNDTFGRLLLHQVHRHLAEPAALPLVVDRAKQASL